MRVIAVGCDVALHVCAIVSNYCGSALCYVRCLHLAVSNIIVFIPKKASDIVFIRS